MHFSRPRLPFDRLHFPVWQIYPPKLCDFVLLYPDGGNGKCSKLSSQCCFVSLPALLIGRIICSAHANKGSLSWEKRWRAYQLVSVESLNPICHPLVPACHCTYTGQTESGGLFVVDGALWTKATWHCHYKWLFSRLTHCLDPMCFPSFPCWPDDAPLVVAAAICVESAIASNLILSFCGSGRQTKPKTGAIVGWDRRIDGSASLPAFIFSAFLSFSFSRDCSSSVAVLFFCYCCRLVLRLYHHRQAATLLVTVSCSSALVCLNQLINSYLLYWLWLIHWHYCYYYWATNCRPMTAFFQRRRRLFFRKQSIVGIIWEYVRWCYNNFYLLPVVFAPSRCQCPLTHGRLSLSAPQHLSSACNSDVEVCDSFPN